MAPVSCAVPANFAAPDEPLLQVAAAIKAGGPVNILAIGSATTVGDQPGAPFHAAFPYRMLDSLQARLPQITFNLTVRGGRGMTAADLLPTLKSTLAAQRFALVLWQTGTVEAVRGQDPDDLQGALQDGIDAAREAGADVVLIDSQFSRFLRANTNLDPYQTTLQQVAAMPGVVLFHRFDVMQSWAEDGSVDMESVSRADRQKVMLQLNTCLGNALAHFVLSGAAMTAQ